MYSTRWVQILQFRTAFLEANLTQVFLRKNDESEHPQKYATLNFDWTFETFQSF
tara:strand:- start:1128 stop:1289 length:162 start_codon:yes stop_codon:yes gene_type:complete